jgi:hypothetical protein
MCVPIIALIRIEENFLVREFGDQYHAYQQRTRRRLLPFTYSISVGAATESDSSRFFLRYRFFLGDDGFRELYNFH